MKGKNIGIIAIIVAGLVLIGTVSYVIIKSNQTVSVWVPDHNMSTGDVVKQEDITKVNIPADTPGNYINNKDKIVGYKLKGNVNEGQLLYSSSFLSSWESYNQDEDIPDDYIITSVQIPDRKAVGGLIVAGDTVDIMGVTNSKQGENAYGNVHQGDNEDAKVEGRNNLQEQVHYVLSNVKVINTNSTLSEAQDNDLSEVVDEESSNSGSYYIIALSYDDAKKLRQAEQIFEDNLWLNITPEQNNDNPPLLDQMVGQPFSGLHDAQIQVQDKDGNPLKIEREDKEDKEDKEKDAKEESKDKSEKDNSDKSDDNDKSDKDDNNKSKDNEKDKSDKDKNDKSDKDKDSDKEDNDNS